MSEFQVKKRDLNVSRVVATEFDKTLNESEILVKIHSFAFTANNMTYGVTGDTLGYWQFFPATLVGEESAADWGILPVWGFADVVVSRSEDVTVGERLFGYFPPADHVVMTPVKVSGGRLIDGSAHRSQLPPGYNSYRRIGLEPDYERSFDNEQMLLFPLFITSFVIWDQLQEHQWYDAKQVLVISASSKTSIGLAYALDYDESAPKAVGLTSSRNLDFVASLGLYEQGVTYDKLLEIDTTLPTVIVDMSGNKKLLGELNNLLGDNMKYCINVGLTHWDANESNELEVSQRSEFFFAPSRIQKRMKEWGPGEFAKRSGGFIQKAAMQSRSWLKPIKLQGLNDLQERFVDIANGRIAPNEGLIIEMGD